MFSAAFRSFVIAVGGFTVVICILTATGRGFSVTIRIFASTDCGFTVAVRDVVVFVCDLASTRDGITVCICILTAAGRGITVPVIDFTVIIHDFIIVALFSSTVGGLLQKRFSDLEFRDVVAQQPIVLVIKRGDVEGMNRHRRFLIEIAFTVDCDLIAVRGLLQRQSGHAEIDQLAFRKLVFT